MRRLVPADEALRRNNFNSLRLVFALLVVLSHSYAGWYGTELDEPLSRLTNRSYNSGNVGVLAFFTISGFLISLSYQRSSSWRSFLRKRIARIVPGYLVAVTLCSLVVVPAFSSQPFGLPDADEARGLLSNLLLRNYIVPSDAFDGGAVNGSLWSIPYEFWCYLGILLLGCLGLLRRGLPFVLLAAAVMAFRFWMDVTDRRVGGTGLFDYVFGFPYFWTEVLPPFLLGAAVLSWRDRLPRSGLLLVALLALVLAAAWLPEDGTWRACLTHLLLPPTLVYLVFYLAFHPRLDLGDAAKRGDISYGCYLYAFPIQQMLRFGVGDRLDFAGFVLLSMALSLVAGAASWLLVERWFEAGRLQRRRRRRPLAEEAALVAP